MKKIAVLAIIGAITFSTYAQEVDSSKVKKIEQLESDSTIVKKEIKTEFEEREDGFIYIKDAQDTTKLKVGKKGIKIIEKDDETKIDIMGDDDFEYEFKHKKRKNRFNGHWSAIELGLNNFMNPDMTYTTKPGNEYLNLNTGKSINFNFNLMQKSFRLIGNNVGLVTGLGFQYNDYKFDGQNSINVVGGQIASDSTFYFDPEIEVTMSKMSTWYFTVPLILEFQAHTRSNTIYLGAGVIGGIKMASWTKVKYVKDGDDEKQKTKGDYNINPFRYEFTARVGINNFGLYANYSPVSFFEKDRGPELNPFSVGVTLNFD